MKRGFTLVEMMVVIVIMGLIFAMIIPFVSRVFYQKTESVNRVYTLLQRARFRAISRLATCRAELDGNNEVVSLWEGGLRVEGPYDLARGTDLRPDAVTWISFYGDGTADDGGGNPPQQITIHYGKNLAGSKTIQVYQASGIPTIQ